MKKLTALLGFIAILSTAKAQSHQYTIDTNSITMELNSLNITDSVRVNVIYRYELIGDPNNGETFMDECQVAFPLSIISNAEDSIPGKTIRAFKNKHKNW